MLLIMGLWQVALRRRPFVCPILVVMVRHVQKAGEPMSVNVWKAGVTRIVAKVKTAQFAVVDSYYEQFYGNPQELHSS
jgi:hypothetical protein